MKRLKGGPELKMPDLKVPQVVKDLHDDLRDRRLLPLVALLIVAIVAVPFLLGEDAEPVPEGPVAAAPEGQAITQASELTAVKATPGLRDYRRRLRARVATDPFVQRFSAPNLKGAKLQSESSTSSGGGESKSSTTGGSSAGTGEPKGGDSGDADGGGAPSNGATGVNVYTWMLDVQIAHTEGQRDGTVEMGEPKRRENVKTLSPLPGPKAPVVTFMGRSPHSGKAVFMVSRDVTGVFGEVDCIAGTDSCELLEMEPGFPATFEYGPGHARYKLTVIEVELVKAKASADGS